MNSNQLREAILEALKPRGSRVLSFSELANRVLRADLEPAHEELLRGAVSDLERRGDIVRVKGEKISRTENTEYEAGILAIRGEGRAFLISKTPGTADTVVTALASALDGDVVLVRRDAQKSAPARGDSRSEPRTTGVVVKVLQRRRETVVGKIVRGPEGTFVIPFDRKIDARLAVPDGKDLDAPAGMFVEARITAYPDDRRLALAEVLELIGFEGDAGVDVEVVARKWGIPRLYPEAVLAEAAEATGTVGRDERLLRSDFTGHTIVTIDGETARDFDDAIEAEDVPNGGFRIGIHIADVSHYVPIGSALDAEAFERGTSVYFPDRAIAMLPERLSNDLCSLRPNEERRTLSAVLTLDRQGETVHSEFFRSLINSRARTTYTMVGDFLEGKSVPEITPEVGAMLHVARRAALALRGRRVRRGSLDFDLPDSDVLLGETGDVVAIVRAVRNEAHRLIEEFMLAANEAVAKHLDLVPTPALYRVHDRPDESRLADIRVVLSPLGYHLPEDDEEISPATFQSILDQAQGTPEERLVSDLVLRAQKKAVYSEECRGHYALAAKHYCHFTSPIRRYPDLLVHRALVEWLAVRRPPAADDAEGRTRWFHEAAAHCSARERRAESAEREAIAWKKFVFLSSRVGEEFWAYVSAVVGFGLFVTLEDIYVDGLVPISLLGDDFYRYEETEHRLVGSSTGRVFRLGDRLKVKLVKADAEKRGLDFAPVGMAGDPGRGARPQPSSRPKPSRKTPPGRGRRPVRPPSPAPGPGRSRRRR